MSGAIALQVVEVLAALALYFLPAIVADHRHRHDMLTLALFNACMGWTVFGWIIALYWAWLPNPPADIAGDIVRKRRLLSMRTFSEGLAARVARRAAGRRAERPGKAG